MTTVPAIHQKNLPTVLGFLGDSSNKFPGEVHKNLTVHRRIVLAPGEITALRETAKLRLWHPSVVFGDHPVVQLVPPPHKQRIVLRAAGANSCQHRDAVVVTERGNARLTLLGLAGQKSEFAAPATTSVAVWRNARFIEVEETGSINLKLFR